MLLLTRILTWGSLLLLSAGTFAQPFTPEERLQGYALTDAGLTFVFDPEVYAVQPQKVVVTGAFRSWDQNMQALPWVLQEQNGLWVLPVEDADAAGIVPNTPFKYRIDRGEWINPPSDAPNRAEQDLVFEPTPVEEPFSAEIYDAYTLWAYVPGERPLTPDAYRITDAKGNVIPVSAVLPNDAHQTLIRPAEALDMRRVYFLEVPGRDLKAFCSFDGWFRRLYSDKPLGANVNGDETSIRLFAPRAMDVKVYLYKGREDKEAYLTESLTRDEQGVWEITFSENLHGVYYDFTVHGADDPGNYFFETNPVHIGDPYARVSDNGWGKCRIWQATEPATPLDGGIPPMEDVIAYEVHVQDFTDNLPVSSELKGTLEGMGVRGLTNKKGRPIGFDYLVELGINVVHLMPVQEYVHFPDDDWQTSFRDDPYMIEQGTSEENYQWGYRTTHAMAVEAKYRTRGEEPGSERDAFRDLVQAFHDEGIAVIIDIVPNHTGENMDGNEWYFHFNAIDKLYYYRTQDFAHIGAYGNEVKTENRPMVQRWLIDQCLHYIEEFGIDGFRIDLAGQVDEQTLKALVAAIGEDKILYGEPWMGSNDPAYEANPDWDWYKADAPITFFQDDSRNAFKGPVFELRDPLLDRGWPGGKFEERARVMLGLANQFPDDKTPLSGISYLDIHDNFALADQFGENFDGRFAVDQDAYKIATTLLFTTLGPIVLHGGSEIMRSKAHAPLREVVKETQAGYKVYMHGYRDTYNHRTANQFVWESVGQKPRGTNRNDYRNMQAFWQGMITLRKSEYGAVFRVDEAVPEGYYQWITPEEESMLGYVVDETVFVLLNAGTGAQQFSDVVLPAGQWELIGTNAAVDPTNGVKGPKALRTLSGGQRIDIPISAKGLLIWVKR